MRLRRSTRLYSLKRAHVRQSWNKYNLYNLAKLRVHERSLTSKTFFQQKWFAKARSRAYHGEHIRESKWERMFSRRFNAVVDMDPRYMAQHDGSEQASGRGSGKLSLWGDQRTNSKNGDRPTPYMQMAYAPLERRLDTAIFRAMFASSARQAKQFVVHGRVKVNGKKMPHPSYLLNPGDMFQVDPDMVLLATGKQKGNLTELQRKLGKKGPYKPKTEAKGEEGVEVSEDAAAEEGESVEAAEAADPEAKAEAEAAAVKQKKGDLKKLLESAKSIIEMDSSLGVKRKQKLRAFQQEVKKVISQSGRASVTSDQIPVEHLANVLNQLSLAPNNTPASPEPPRPGPGPSEGTTDEIEAAFDAVSDERGLSRSERRRFELIMQEYRENPHDESKPYRTPWEPRPWMSPFAFIPRYLEVNQNICSAVYLRHPVARQGHSEVPTPFPEMLGQLSFNWYLRRR
ncbi:hypothetical protein RB594_000380 [Gaeumannomyces avenae]